jgi:hypothetical protein
MLLMHSAGAESHLRNRFANDADDKSIPLLHARMLDIEDSDIEATDFLYCSDKSLNWCHKNAKCVLNPHAPSGWGYDCICDEADGVTGDPYRYCQPYNECLHNNPCVPDE